MQILRKMSLSMNLHKLTHNRSKSTRCTVEAPDRSLPVVANVVSEFVKAGWPKGDQK